MVSVGNGGYAKEVRGPCCIKAPINLLYGNSTTQPVMYLR